MAMASTMIFRPRILAFLNIGQSRQSSSGEKTHNDNLDQDFADALLPTGWIIFNISPLDAYAASSVPSLFAPERGEMPLRSCLSTGDDFLASHRRLTPELNKALATAVNRGADVAVVTCTTDFELHMPKQQQESSEANSQLKLILPGRVLASAAAARDWRGVSKVAILCPVDDQLGPLAHRWRARLPSATEVMAVRISPNEKLETWSETGFKLKSENGVRVVILDCFGYSIQQGRRLEAAGLEVLAAKQLTIEDIASLEY